MDVVVVHGACAHNAALAVSHNISLLDMMTHFVYWKVWLECKIILLDTSGFFFFFVGLHFSPLHKTKALLFYTVKADGVNYLQLMPSWRTALETHKILAFE